MARDPARIRREFIRRRTLHRVGIIRDDDTLKISELLSDRRLGCEPQHDRAETKKDQGETWHDFFRDGVIFC